MSTVLKTDETRTRTLAEDDLADRIALEVAREHAGAGPELVLANAIGAGLARWRREQPGLVRAGISAVQERA